VPIDAEKRELEPGAAVAVGPDAADDETVRVSVVELARFVALGGLPAAGAGVDLGNGFRSARLDGAGGDRRDAVLAALRVLGVRGAARIGDRAGLIVALFGPDVTKPVGSAAARAIGDGRWAALQLASAASDLLGPEQLEKVLALANMEGAESTTDGMASVLAEHLGQVLAPVPRPRRLTLLLDLWRVVIAHRAVLARLERLREIRGRQDRFVELRRRYEHLVEDEMVGELRTRLGHEPTVGEAVRWLPDGRQMRTWLSRAMHDALAATALLRVAIAVAEDGPADGLARCRGLLGTASMLLSDDAARRANRRVPGLLGIPARPGCYLRQIDERLRDHGDAGIDLSTVAFVRQRLARAGDYARVVLDAVPELLYLDHVRAAATTWRCEHLRQWRGVAGYTDVRPPTAWEQPTLATGPTLAQRLRDSPEAGAEQAEYPGDLLWYAELADALAQLRGHRAAVVIHDEEVPDVDHDPEEVDDEPLRPRPDSIELAVAGAAQLVSLGAEVPARARTWAELVDGLLAATTIAEAMTGGFKVPEPLSARDGVVVPGTEARVELARDPQRLAEWARYMGNCIAGPYYLKAAREGRCVLVALRDPGGRILANVELEPGRGGWHIGQFKARFNNDPPADLARRVRAWVATLPAAHRPATKPGRPHLRGRVGHHRGQLLREVGPPLRELAARALQRREVAGALAIVGGAGILTGVTALRRASGRRLEEILRQRLADDPANLAALWRATGVRPMAMALSGLDPALRQRYAHLELLTSDGPLPVAPARLARLPEVADARTADLVGRRLRAAIGRLARHDDPVLAPAVARHADTGMLCALLLALSTAPQVGPEALTPVTTAGSASVPGFPGTRLDDADGPWQRARPDAAELGGDPEWTPERIVLTVPTSWLGPGGWRALWARAARASRARANS